MSWGRVWRWSWIVTLPVTVAFCYWAARTWTSFAALGLRYDTAPLPYPLSDAGDAEFQHLLKRLERSFTTPLYRLPRHDGELRTIHLFADDSALAELDSNLPHSGFEFVKGSILDLVDGKPEQVKCRLRYRGDFVVHWGYPKKSWRVKTSAGRLWEGMRTFNLQAPKFPSQLNNYIGYRLARIMGLIVPEAELVQVAVNGEPRGVHLLVEQLEELTLRRANKMPGDMYSGELMAKDRYSGIINSVFRHPGVWTKVSVNNHYPAAAMPALEKLLRLVQAPASTARHEELSKLLDMEAWGRFSAFETLIQSWHFDDHHNWRLFWDSNRGRIVPVVWDPIALAPGMFVANDTIADVVASQIHAVLFQNGDFLRARQRAFRDFFARGLDADYLAIYDDVVAPLRRAVAVDPMTRPTSRGRIFAAIDELRGKIEQITTDLRREFVGTEGRLRHGPLGDDRVLALDVEGRAPIERLVLRFEQPVGPQRQTKVRYYRAGRAVEVDVSGATSPRGNELAIDLGMVTPLHAYWRRAGDVVRAHRKLVLPAYYEVVLGADVRGNPLREVVADRGRGAIEHVTLSHNLERRDLGPTYLPVVACPAERPLVLHGTVPITGDIELTQDLVIRPGTVFAMAPAANIRFTGRVLAEGTRRDPIRFVPKAPGQEPWGVVALQGQRCNGSRFRFCEFEFGSGWKQPLWEYSAMFSIHDCRDVVVRDCAFRDSQVVDDMVHAVYAHVEFVDCLFERSLADAFDMDICTGVVEGCTFRQSGNDALDLMTCSVVVADTLLEESGDKGISVGENTSLLAIGNRFLRCNIGMQGKDSSIAHVYNCEFDGNNTAVDAYRKNWRYDGGGHLFIHKSRFVNTQRGLSADRHSEIEVQDCYLDVPPAADPRIRLADCDAGGTDAARSSRRLDFPATLDHIGEFAQPYFRRVVTQRRGPGPASR